MTAPGETRPDARGVVRVLFVLFLTYHAAGVLSTLIPSPSALADRTWPLFASYLKLTGTEQDWSMFTSVPNRQSSQVTVSSFDAAGLRREHGAIIPGLRDYDTDETFRYHSIFDRYSTLASPIICRDTSARLRISSRPRPASGHRGFKSS